MSGQTFLQPSTTEKKLGKNVDDSQASYSLSITVGEHTSTLTGTLSPRQHEQLLLLLLTDTTEEATRLRNALNRALAGFSYLNTGQGAPTTFQDELNAIKEVLK